jgi:hypothetical protein
MMIVGSDSVENAKKELGLVFEGWNVDWWLDVQENIARKTREKGR